MIEFVAIVLAVVCIILLFFALFRGWDSDYYKESWKRCAAQYDDLRDRSIDWERRAQSAESKLSKIQKITKPE